MDRRVLDEGPGLVVAQAQTAHAGVDVERRFELPPDRSAMGSPAGELFDAVEDRCEVVEDELFFGARHHAVQHRDRDGRQHVTDRNGLRQLGHEEVGATNLRQRDGDLGRTQSVAVCLDHRGSRNAVHLLQYLSVVGADVGQVDREAAASEDSVGHGSAP
jgi:hypothetical protein